jgi:hypothetical protein
MRVALVVLSLALVSGAVTGTAGSAGSQTPTAEPTLLVVKRTPVVIEGTGFPEGSVVTLVARAPGLVDRRTVRPGPRGQFRAVFERLSLTGPRRCAVGVVIWARTETGAVALWQPKGLPNCPAPLRPTAKLPS